MEKILYIRKPCKNKDNGIGRYCSALYDLFEGHKVLQPQPIKDYPTRKSLLVHYYDKTKPLYNAIKQADIIHINGYTDMGTVQAFILSKLLRKKIVYTAHWHPFKRLTHPLGGRIFFNVFLKPLISLFANKIICINNEDSTYFKKFSKHVVQIPHWFNKKNQKITCKKQANMILFVGRINDKVKGIQHLFALPEGKYDICCVGHGDFSFKRKDMTHYQNISDEELAELYSKASLLVVPSLYEAFSYVTLESLSFETPVVMSERVRIADYLGNQKGYSIFKYGDMEDFVNKVKSTIGTKVESERILNIFKPEKIKKKYEQIYLDND